MPVVDRSKFASAPSDDVSLRKEFTAEAAVDEKARTVTATITTDDVDRSNDTVSPDGWELEDFLRSPVVLWAHDRKQPPIAQAIDVKRVENGLQSTSKFPDEGIYPFADMVFNLIKGGFIRATSVGFRPIEWNENSDRGGFDFTKQSLLEWSWVPVPANQAALIAAADKGVELALLCDWAAGVIKSLPESDAGELVAMLTDTDGVSGAPEEAKAATEGDGATAPSVGAEERWRDAAIGRICSDVEATRLRVGDIEEAALIAAGSAHQLEDLQERLDALNDTAGATLCALHSVLSVEIPGTLGLAAEPQELSVEESQIATFATLREAVDPNDTVRWNKALSDDFDVTQETLPASSVAQAMTSKYCGCEVKDLAERSVDVRAVKMGAFLLALDEELKQRKDVIRVEDVRNIRHDGTESAPVFKGIKLNSKQDGTFLVSGFRFMDLVDISERMVFSVAPRWWGLQATTYAKQGEGAARAAEFMAAVQVRANNLKLLKGEAFSLSGEFLDRGDLTFEDVILTEGNAKALERTVELVNEQGSQMENRGLLLLGPAGTGKTLSGRVIMNQAPDATFIWLAARDFYYGGGFESIDEAFALAAENAPSVIFMEDVDSYLSTQVTDMLKTAMDGLATTKGIVTMLTSNYPERLPKAIIDRPGRFHDVMRFDLPDEPARRVMLARWLPDLEGKALETAIEALAGYSGAHVREFARFVDVIRGQDGLPVDDAAVAALDKIAQQRDLITSIQSRGSFYSAPAHVKAVTAEAPVTEPADLDCAIELADEDDVVLELVAEGGSLDLDVGGGELAIDADSLALDIQQQTVNTTAEFVKTAVGKALRYHRGQV